MFRIARTLVLPLILSIFPLLVLLHEVDTSHARAAREDEADWLNSTAPVVRVLKEASAPEFWARTFSHRLKTRVEYRLKHEFPTGIFRGGATILAPMLSEAINKSHIRGLSTPRIWAVAFPDGVGSATVEPCFGTSIETVKRGLITPLIQQAVRSRAGYPTEIMGQKWENKIQTLFGSAINGAFFRGGMRETPFPVIFNDTDGLIVWNDLRLKSRVVGAYLVFLPVPPEQPSLSLTTILKNWKDSRKTPVFLSLPVRPGAARDKPVTLPGFRDPAARRVIADVQARMQMITSQSLVEEAGGIRIPSYLAGRMITSRGWSFRFFPLSKSCKHLGLLFERLSPSKPGLADQTLWICGITLGFAWLLVAIRFSLTGTLPSPRVRENLLLWFFSVIAVPLLLGISAGGNLLADRRSNLIAALEQDMVTSLEAIEAESGGIIPNQERMIRDLFSRPALVKEFRAAQLEKRSTKPILDRLWREGCDLGFRMCAMMIIGRGGFIQSRIETEFSQKLNATIIESLHYSMAPKLASEPAPTDNFGIASESHAGNSLMTLLGHLDVDLSHNTTLDNVDRIWFRWMSFSMRLWLDEKVWYIATLLWNQDLAFRTFLIDRIGRANRVDEIQQNDRPGQEGDVHVGEKILVELGAFHVSLDGLEPIVCSKNGSRGGAASLRRIAERGKSERTSMTQIVGSETWLTLAFPSKRMPDFVLAARVPLSPILKDLHWEAVTLFLMLIAAIALVFTVAFLLSEFLAVPIVRMSQGLERIASGDLDVTVAESRSDELGEAGIALDRMTRSLLERRTISRFVAPQVLELVAGGDLESAAIGRIREVTVLASDMRNFTTISESQPPRDVFSTLNRHLTAMTQAIQTHGGAIDRFIGDAVVAVFYPGGPLPSPVRALSAAKAMMAAHADLQTTRKAAGEFQYSIGVGIETGRVVTGVMGDEETRLDFTVIGEPASRAVELENLSKLGKASRIVVSQAVRRSIDTWKDDTSLNSSDHVFLPLDGESDAWELTDSSQSNRIHDDFDSRLSFIPGVSHATSDEKRHDNSDKIKISEPSTTLTKKNKHVDNIPPAATSFTPAAGKSPECNNKIPQRHSSSVLLFLLWFLPLILIGSAMSSFRRSSLETEQRKIQTLLLEDAAWIGKTIQPRLQTTLYLRKCIEKFLKRFPRNLSVQEARTWIPKHLASNFRKIEARLPGLSWTWCGYPRIPSHSTSEQKFVPDELLSVTGSRTVPIDRSASFKLSEAIYAYIVTQFTSFEDQSDVNREWSVSGLRKLIHSDLPTDILNQSMNALHPTTFNKTETMFLCCPVSLHNLRGHSSSLVTEMKIETALLKVPTRARNSPVSFRRQFFGNLFIFIDPSNMTPKRSIKLIAEYLKNRGALLSIVNNQDKLSEIANKSVFDASNSFAVSIGITLKKMLDSTIFSFTRSAPSCSVLFHSVRLGDHIFHFQISRPILESSLTRHLPIIFAIVSIFWTLFCIGFLFQRRFDIRISLRLHGLLTGAFLLAVVPSLIPAILILERSRHESDLRLEKDERARIEAAARTFDEAREFGNSWIFALFDTFFRNPDFIKSLRSSTDNKLKNEDDTRKI
ncbi:MAG: adenylate/guanylate cyclase domain-containing protein, partial [Candidatus Riflebacteria bacterium]|nr:adenylate/guanylate cyclase domain-containing protein [Candidatus Riflebacteria bacterium]